MTVFVGRDTLIAVKGTGIEEADDVCTHSRYP